MILKKPKIYLCKTYKINFLLFIGTKPEDFSKFVMKKYNYDKNYHIVDGSCLFCEKDGYQEICIWVRNKKDYSCIAHECTHAAIYALNAKGYKIDPDNDEPLCYLVEELVRESVSGR